MIIIKSLKIIKWMIVGCLAITILTAIEALTSHGRHSFAVLSAVIYLVGILLVLCALYAVAFVIHALVNP